MDNTKYVICTTPRSGSNLLCGLLSSSKKMGQPSEYLNPWGTLVPSAKDNQIVDPEGRISLKTYIEYIIQNKSTSNGCFGLKLLFDQLETFGEFQAVRDLLKQSRYIWLVRQDFIAQAVSLYIATETDAWKSFQEEKKTREKLEYNEERIQYYAERMLRHNLAWEMFFQVNQFEYLRVNYEDILETPQRICKAICEFCEIETEHNFSIDKVKFKKQGDSLNEKFASTFQKNSRLNFNQSEYTDKKLNFKGIHVGE